MCRERERDTQVRAPGFCGSAWSAPSGRPEGGTAQLIAITIMMIIIINSIATTTNNNNDNKKKKNTIMYYIILL